MAEGNGARYGPLLIGTCLNCILYGATVIQGLIYFQTYKSDKWWMKMFISYLLFCETLNTIFDAGVVYEPLIIRYGTPQVSTIAPIMLATHPLMTVIISFPVQLFIAWRVKVMSRSYVLPVVISLFAFAAFAGGFATSMGLICIKFEYSRFAESNGAVITWLASSAAADIIITTSLVRSLLRKRTGFPATDDVINRLIRLTVQTGLMTAIAATLDVTLYMALKEQSWNFVWDFMLSKLYSNTILSSLNARGGLKATSTVRDNVLFGHGTVGETTTRNRTQIEIMTTVITEVEPRQDLCTMPMKAFDSEGSYGKNDSDSSSAVNVVPAYAEAV